MLDYAWTPGRWALVPLTLLGLRYAPDMTALLWVVLIIEGVQ